MPTRTRTAEHARACDRILQQLSPANRDLVAYSLTLRRNKGVKDGSNENWLRAIRKADTALAGKSFREATPADMTHVVSQLRVNVSERTAHLHVMLLRHFLKELLDEDRLPKAWDRATAVRKPKAVVSGQVITPAMFEAMLRECANLETVTTKLIVREKAEAILWTLRASGFRAGELLALDNGDVAFDEGGAWLNLRDGAGDLKTGGRRIYIVDGVPALKTWVALHPARQNREAPLFPGLRSKDGLQRLAYKDLGDLVRGLAERSGANATLATNDGLTCHDFRHTCATEKARLAWNEAQMRRFFGWSSTSYMPSVYVHLNLDDMRAAVRRDAGLASPTDARAGSPKIPDSADLILDALARRLATMDNRTL
jgi:integrase